MRFSMAILAVMVLSSLVSAAEPDGKHVPLVFSGGHDTDPRDHGRPVILVASALKVTADEFRDAFSHVKPAPAGEKPQEEQVRKNKDALMKALGPKGVTNDRLDEVSNFYRYRPGKGNLWKNTPAEGYAIVKDGKVVGFKVTNAGAGYSTAPTVTIEGMDTPLVAEVHFDTDLAKNGSIASVAEKPAK